jgi:hypothetical protein
MVLAEDVAGYTYADPKSAIIVVGRLGAGERSRALNWRRLRTVRSYLSVDKKLASVIILAEGERVAGLGQVEFYVSGKLVATMTVARNRNIRFYD